MQIPISDLMEDCFFENIDIEEEITVSPELKQNIMNQIKTEPQFRKRTRPWRYLAVAAAAALASCTVFAAGMFALNKQRVRDGVKGTTVAEALDGTLQEFPIEFQGEGMKFTFSCTGKPHEIWFHPGYLPESTKINPDENLNIEGETGWYQYLTSEEESTPTTPIPWQISVHYAAEDSEFFLPGEVKVVKEETWDALQVTEVSVSGLPGQPFGDEIYNGVFLFDPQNGHLIQIMGTMRIGELEQIAKNLEIKITGHAMIEPEQNKGLSLLGLGRG